MLATQCTTRAIGSILFILALLFAAACGGTSDPPLDPPGPDPDGGLPAQQDGAMIAQDSGQTQQDGPGQDTKSTPPPKPPGVITAHVDPGCSKTIYQINVGTVQTTCSSLWSAPDDVIQVTIGDLAGTAPLAGRSYTVKSPSQINIYPNDGEAAAVFLKKNNATVDVTSGSVTLNPSAAANNITGHYTLTLSNGKPLNGAFRADTCQVDSSSCN